MKSINTPDKKIVEGLIYMVTSLIDTDVDILRITIRGEKIFVQTKKGVFEIETKNQTFIDFGTKFYGAVISCK